MNDWLTAITAHRREQAEKPPPGFLTRAEAHGQIGKSERQCDAVLRTLTAAGMCERRVFRIQTPQGLRPVPHYRLIHPNGKRTRKDTRKDV
jgi:hypothetical protein